MNDIKSLPKGLVDAVRERITNEWIKADGSRRRVAEKDGRKGSGTTVKDAPVKEVTVDKSEYQKFFQSALKKFGVKSPAELKGDKEKEFYDYVDKNWKGDNESD